jgi:phage protein D
MDVRRAKAPATTLWYEGVDLSAQLTPYVRQLVYVDHLEGDEPDALEVALEDRQRLLQGPLYPRHGAALAFAFGYEGGEQFASGAGFQIDEIEVDGPPDVVTLRAIGNLPASRIHDRTSYAWRGVTLEQIARSIAAKHGLAVTVEADRLAWTTLTQHDEGDLAFLKRLAREYGLVCSLKGGKDQATLILLQAEALERSAPVYELGRSDTTRYRFRNKIQPGSRGSYTRYFDSELKELVEFEINLQPGQEQDRLINAPRPTLHGQSQQLRHVLRGPRRNLEVHAKRALRSSKSYEREATLSLPGRTRLRSGVTVMLAPDGEDGWGASGGKYLVLHSRHTCDPKRGYATEITIRRTLQ